MVHIAKKLVKGCNEILSLRYASFQNDRGKVCNKILELSAFSEIAEGSLRAHRMTVRSLSSYANKPSNKNLSLLIQKSKCRSLRLNVTVISKSPKKQTKKLNKIPKSTLVSPFFYRFLP